MMALSILILLLSCQNASSFIVNSIEFSLQRKITDYVPMPNQQRFSQELYSVIKSRTAILDGSSFNALDAFLVAEGKSSSSSGSNLGYCSVVTAKMPNNAKVVGIRVDSFGQENENLEKVVVDNGVEIYKDSMATIPKSISDDDAISTTIASMAGIHCALYNPILHDDKLVQNIGGSSEKFVSDDFSKIETSTIDNKKAVVVGGGDFASFVADGMAAIGAEVTQVSTNKMLRRRKFANVSISLPAVGDLDIGFSSAIGQFDVLVDTLSDEAKAGESMCIGVSNDWDDFSTDNGDECSSAVIMQLKSQHGCNRYISTMCNAQRMVRDNGIIFGRNDALKYTKEMGNKKSQMNGNHIVPPKQFGSRTLQKLLDSNVLFKSNNKEPSWVQGWSMKDYWELTSWPRDSSGAANVRFGFPVVEDLNSLFGNNGDDIERKEVPSPANLKLEKSKTEPDDTLNPFIFQVTGVEDLNREILGKNKKCILFMSSASCRTCKYLTPQFTKLSKDFIDKDVVFAKVNAFSKKGKELSKVLGVDAVPAFVLFRDGQRFGTTLSTTRIPSKKLDFALELLCSGEEWDAKTMSNL